MWLQVPTADKSHLLRERSGLPLCELLRLQLVLPRPMLFGYELQHDHDNRFAGMRRPVLLDLHYFRRQHDRNLGALRRSLSRTDGRTRLQPRLQLRSACRRLRPLRRRNDQLPTDDDDDVRSQLRRKLRLVLGRQSNTAAMGVLCGYLHCQRLWGASARPVQLLSADRHRYAAMRRPDDDAVPVLPGDDNDDGRRVLRQLFLAVDSRRAADSRRDSTRRQ